ncbi:glycosyltransferase family 2 protein [Arthrobacter sp. USHLN218]|uniref:glycosyltransferase family 2 protein n=1 Tax=Arthrobacter sp. USHLN218 TaxID=3081232 RepID=UPI0030189C72
MEPSLSVVIPAYRASQTLPVAIKSAFDSGAEQVIVVDDGSDDDTAAVAEKEGATCVSQENAGAAQARINGARLVVSKYLIFLDADDALIPEGVRGSIRRLEENRGLVVAAGTVIGQGAGGAERLFPIRYSPVTTESLLKHGYGPWPPCAAVVSTAGYRRCVSVDPQPLNPAYAEDYELLIRLSQVGQIDVRNDPTCRYSLSGGKSSKSALRAIEAKERIRAHYADFLCLEIQLMSLQEREMAALVRAARAHRAQGSYLRASMTMINWISKDPAYAARKLLSKPWQRN